MAGPKQDAGRKGESVSTAVTVTINGEAPAPKPADGWIQTFTGRQVWPAMIEPGDICIEDIAHHLANICRFNGACSRHYSVAEHSLLVSEILPRHLQLWGLLHDAAEAYTGDVVRPLKRRMELVGFPEEGQTRTIAHVEDGILRVIAGVYYLPWPMPQPVRIADNVMLATEKRDLMAAECAPWETLPEPTSTAIPTYGYEIEKAFLKKFNELTRG